MEQMPILLSASESCASFTGHTWIGSCRALNVRINGVALGKTAHREVGRMNILQVPAAARDRFYKSMGTGIFNAVVHVFFDVRIGAEIVFDDFGGLGP